LSEYNKARRMKEGQISKGVAKVYMYIHTHIGISNMEGSGIKT